MSKVQIYSKTYCPYCKAAKSTLDQLNIDYEDFDVAHDQSLLIEMLERSQRRTVPQIFVNGHHLGGNDDLQAALKNGHFEALLNSERNAA